MFTGRAAGSVLVDGQEGRAMTIDLVFVTHNRLEYTKLALASVLADPSEEFSLTIWDNASTDGTVESGTTHQLTGQLNTSKMKFQTRESRTSFFPERISVKSKLSTASGASQRLIC